MKQMKTSTDPRYLLFREHKPSSDLVRHNNCASYAMGNDATIHDYASRTHPLLTKPEPGDGAGIPYKLYRIAFDYSVDGAIKMTEANGAILLGTGFIGALPEAPSGYRRVAMFFGGLLENAQYHFLREGPDGLWTQKNCEFPARDRDNQQNLITDPREAYFHGYPKGPWLFAVPENGIEMRMSREWTQLLPLLNAQLQVFKKNPAPDSCLAGYFRDAAVLLSGRHDHLASAMEAFAGLVSQGRTKPAEPKAMPRLSGRPSFGLRS